METVGDSDSKPQPRNPRNPKRPAIVRQLTSCGYSIKSVIMRKDGSTEYVLAGGAGADRAQEPNPWHE
jgi:hypothetical protein